VADRRWTTREKRSVEVSLGFMGMQPERCIGEGRGVRWIAEGGMVEYYRTCVLLSRREFVHRCVLYNVWRRTLKNAGFTLEN
jgi:hypothetical protein